MTEVNIPDSPKPQPKKAGRKKPIDMRINRGKPAPKPKITFDEDIGQNYFYGLVPKELAVGIKGMILKGLALPAKQKQGILYTKLKQSDYINKYLEKYLSIDLIASLNDHVKFVLVYAFIFMESMLSRQLTPDELADIIKQANLKPEEQK